MPKLSILPFLLRALGSFQSGTEPDGVARRQVQRMLVLRLPRRGSKFVDACVPTVMAMAISYNWLFLWDYTFHKWGDLLLIINGISGHNCSSRIHS